MTPEVLRSLIAGAETLDVEFKGEEARALSDGDLVEAVVCLANRPGTAPGWLLVGVEDDGRVTGARPRHADRTDPLRLQALIAHRTRPSLSARVQVVRLADQNVIAIEVPAARSPVGTSDGKYLRSNFATAGRRRATRAATRPGWCSCSRVAEPTSHLRGSWRKKARHSAPSGSTTCSC